MRSHLHADDVGSWPAGDGLPRVHDLPPVKLRPPWLIFLARHFAPRNHERYLLQGIELTEEELAAIRAMPRKRPWWLVFLRRQFHRVFPEAED
jgi:hypothetical protein